ncbi:M23 family metallopeptidase [Cryobacterium sp. PH31-O1]|uniref:M23 family metallopeptidase n=1 Tax=Cryobacterium sp. PH31-O1 TaxID=3046306 RepID=UPI0024BA1319|nr:M23 family metallopeptidase [Cryobacterium sp. PH31-O1]MDJ0337476.1 M23 family metallopeptidase [Cryobacterium sp. PH31-O1]
MPLRNYILNGPSTVILFDHRDPFESWNRHVATAGRGGIDLVAAVGTPIYAPTSGEWHWRKNNGSAGNSGEFHHDDNAGWRDVFSHLSSYVGTSGQHFEQGECIGHSGKSGNVVQHLHRHLLDPSGVRRNPWLYFVGTSTATNGSTPINITAVPAETSPAMSTLIRNYDGSIGLVTEDGELIPLGSMTEVDSLRATGLVGDFVQMPDGLIWDTLTTITARKLAQRTANPAGVASAIAPLLVSAVLAGLTRTGATLTEAQVTEAAEVAIRNVFADAAK